VSILKHKEEWVTDNMPQLLARGPDFTRRIIDQAIGETRLQRSLAVLCVILVPALFVNVYHAEIVQLMGGATSRVMLLVISVVVSAIAAEKVSARILHKRIEKLAHTAL
jgi:hypothetical protein